MTHNIHNRQTSTLSAESEPTIQESKRHQTHALDSAATGIGHREILGTQNYIYKLPNIRVNQSIKL